MAEIQRVEVYVDGSSEPFQVVTQPPFKVRLDPADFVEGDHHMRVVVTYDNGDYHDYAYVFTISHKPEVEISHINQAPIFSPVEVDLLDPMESEMPPPGLLSQAILPVALFLIIVVVAAWFSISGDSAVSAQVSHVEEISKPAAAAPATGSVDGQAIFAEKCAACHQLDGKGQGDVFPALAGNPNLADTDMVIDTVLHGRPGTAMVAWGEQMNDEQIAAVINYILSAWGNDFGSVTVEDVAAKR